MKNTTTQTSYSQAENYGRGLAIKLLNRVQSGLTFDLLATDSPTDFVFTATTPSGQQTVYNAETKHRNYNHNSFSWWLLEKGKFEELVNTPNGLYINTYADGYMVVWTAAHIDGLELPLNSKECVKKTLEPEEGTKIKHIYNLPTAEAYLIVSPNGEYKINKQNKR